MFRNQPHDLDPTTNQDGTPDGIIEVSSPDPGRALITGRADDFFPFPPGSFDHLDTFSVPVAAGASAYGGVSQKATDAKPLTVRADGPIIRSSVAHRAAGIRESTRMIGAAP